jgi:cysteinyl-tRNA synthetase, unknown class
MNNKLFLISLLLIVTTIISCNTNRYEDIDFRKEMVDFIVKIDDYASPQVESFGVFPQNGCELAEYDAYINAVEGIGQEDLYYGYDGDGIITPSNETSYIETYLDILNSESKLILVTNYPFDDEDVPSFTPEIKDKIDDSYTKSFAKNYIPFCTVRNLNYLTINPEHTPQSNVVNDWEDVTEFLYMLQPSDGMTRDVYLNKIANSDYDLIIMDYSFDGADAGKFTYEEINHLKTQLGGKLLCYLSIGEAENYRYYWDESWDDDNDGTPDGNAPDWLKQENPYWEGNYKVEYWNDEWQDIITGYLQKIIDVGFDGVYLDIIDAYEYFENL